MNIIEGLGEFVLDLISLVISADWQVFSTVVRDIAVAVSAVWAVWAGQKGLRKYLFDEDIKERTKRVRAANEVAHKQASSVLEDIEAVEQDNGPATENDMQSCRDWAEKLSKGTRGASSSVQTYAFLLRQLLLVARPSYKSDSGGFHVISSGDLLNLVYMVAAKIAHDAAHIVDVPNHPDENNKIRKRKGAHRFVLPEASAKFPGGRYGLDLRPQSTPAYEFYSAVVRGTSSHMLRKECLRILRSNVPAVLKLFEHKVYVPPVLGVDTDSAPNSLQLMASVPMYFIGIRRQVLIGEKQGVVWKVMYANLNGGIRYAKSADQLAQMKKYYQDLVTGSQEFNRHFDKARVWVGEVVEIDVIDSEMRRLRGPRKWKLKRWLHKIGVRAGG